MTIIIIATSICVAIYYIILGYIFHRQRKIVQPSSDTNTIEIMGSSRPIEELLTTNDLESNENDNNKSGIPTFVTLDEDSTRSEYEEEDNDDDDDVVYMATGVTFEDIQFALDVIKDEKSEDEKKEKEAGEILSRMLNTEMLESIVDQMPGYEQKIRNLIDNYISDDYKQFQIQDYL